MDVTLPNGYVIQGIPEGTTKEEIKRKAIAAGYASELDFQQAGEQAPSNDAPDIYGDDVAATNVVQQVDDSTFADKAIGAGEAALTAVTGATGGTIGMIGGALRGIAEEMRAGNFGTSEAANRIEQHAADVMRKFTYEPRTEKGREYIQDLGEVASVAAPLAGLGGELAQIGMMAKASAPQVVSAAKPIAQAAKKSVSPIVQAAKPASDIAKGLFTYQTPTKQRIAALIEKGVPDADTAKYKLLGGASAAAESLQVSFV
ncbi:MAG: hypothetical protein IPP74_15555, partial [Alphaproteobacteria bacterium]|nr:hypothetical protein [Alphaproteobacteria bacterium]